MAEIEGLVRALRRALREGDNAAKTGAARALGSLACSHANRVLIAAAGGIPPLVELLCDGSAYAKLSAAWALRNLARLENNKVLIAEAGGIPSLVELLRDGDAAAKYQARWTLGVLAENSASNAVAIAAAVGLEALVELARRGRVTVDGWTVEWNASVLAKRKAALLVAALLEATAPRTRVSRYIKAAIGSYL